MAVGSLWWFSYFSLWALTIVLFAAVALLYRHLAHYVPVNVEPHAPRGGPKINEPVEIRLTTITGESYELGRQSAKPHIIFFGMPDCEPCESLRLTLTKQTKNTTEIGLVVVYRADLEGVGRYIAGLPSVVGVADPKNELMRIWRVPGIPYYVIIGSSGIVERKGTAATRKEWESVLTFARAR